MGTESEISEELDIEILKEFAKKSVALVLEINNMKSTESKTYDEIFDELSKKYGLTEYEFTLAVKAGTEIISKMR